MKYILYSCIFASATSVVFAQATEPLLDASADLAYELLLEGALSNESVRCDDPACTCSMLLDGWTESTNLRAKNENFQVSCDKMQDHAKDFVRRHFPILAKEEHQASVKAHTAALAAANNICSLLSKQLNKNNSMSIDNQHLNRALKTGTSSIPTNKAIPPLELVATVDAHIKDFFSQQEYTVDYIPAEMKKEYASERLKIIFYYKKLMDNRKTDIIPELDIKEGVAKAFKPFIERAQQIHLWNWAIAEIANLKKDDRSKTPSSYLIPNPESKKLKKYLGFLDKK